MTEDWAWFDNDDYKWQMDKRFKVLMKIFFMSSKFLKMLKPTKSKES